MSHLPCNVALAGRQPPRAGRITLPAVAMIATLAAGKPAARAGEPPAPAAQTPPTAVVAPPPTSRPPPSATATMAASPTATMATAPDTAKLAAGPEPNAAARAGSPQAEDEDEWEGLPCVVVGRPGCGTQAHVELGMGWGESHSYVGTQWSYHGFFEAGVLVGLGRDWQLGPVAELGFDTGRVNSGYTLSAKLKGRYWIAGWYVSVDGALGAAFERFVFDDGWEKGTREGLTGELAFTVLGAIGPYVSFNALPDPGGIGATETRWLVGFRGSIASWGLALGAIGEGLGGGPWLLL